MCGPGRLWLGGWGSTGTERGQRPVLPGQDRRPACSQDEKASRSLKTGAAIKTAQSAQVAMFAARFVVGYLGNL